MIASSSGRERAISFLSVLREAGTLFFEDRAKRLSAGLAYYALFALVPTLLLSVGVAAAFVGREAASGELATQMSGVQASLDGLLIDRPRRNIVRRPR